MSGRVLIVDDVELNLKLLQARLHAEYYDVVTATRGSEALAICAAEHVDLVLLDVMMPEMDGYEVCRRLKAGYATRHIPVILVTALDAPSDRVRGLEAGADDFLTKPVRDLQLLSRVKSLLRLKFLTDELRVRSETTARILGESDLLAEVARGGRDGRVLVSDDPEGFGRRMARILGAEQTCEIVPPDALGGSASGAELVILDLDARNADPLWLCARLRSNERTRHLPVLVLAGDDDARVAKALEIGASDYLLRPLDRNELLARVRTQIKRRRYEEGLRRSLRSTVELAVTDPLTGLHNRRFLEAHLPGMLERAAGENRPLSLCIADIDHFKRVNDSHGHDVGDEVLKEFARRLKMGSRASDLCCRMGGEEFVVVMPDADTTAAVQIAERIRELVSALPFMIAGNPIAVTVSVGMSVLDSARDDGASLLKRADLSLYQAKRAGRNRVARIAA